MRRRFYRNAEISRRGELERDSVPQLQMFLLVALTGGAGLFASYLLLLSGMLHMGTRYLLSFGIAYIVFLFLLWLWLRTRADQYADPGVPEFGSFGSDAPATAYSGKGGTFDGGGASGNFETSGDSFASVGEDSGFADGAVSTVAEAEEFAIPLAVILVVAAMFLSSLFMVYSAPVLFAELLVDGLLSASLFRKLRGLQTRHWLETALHRTALPFALTALAVSASGWVMGEIAPDAHSIGAFISHVRG